jgi:hypothetical protein
LGGGTVAILAALTLFTCLAAFQLTSDDGAFAGLPGFVAAALGDPQRESPVSDWRTFEHGVSKPTSWGHVSIAFHDNAPEKFFTISRRQGVRYWHWRLMARGVGTTQPVRILDAQGRNVTPRSLSWTMIPTGGSWFVKLRVDDRNLPIPYVIEPVVGAQRGIR